MNKAELLAKAIETSLAAVEPRRALCWRLYREHVARITPAQTVADLANHFAAEFFAAEAVNAEAQAVCRCYIAYTDIFKAETREKSARLQPIRDSAARLPLLFLLLFCPGLLEAVGVYVNP